LNKNRALAATSSGNKGLLRKVAIEKRKTLSFNFIQESSKTITEKLLSNFIFRNKKIHLFYPIKTKPEIDTWFIHKELINQNCKHYTSFHNIKKDTWDCIQFDPKVDFTETTFKVPVPVKYLNSFYTEIDIIIIPLLAFDKDGNRIGYGKGVYDKIISNLNPNCIKIGVSFFEGEKEKIHTQIHDKKLDYCQTTNKLYKFI
jgi:5-formyltetrahydrofolate cyclo-ligase